MSINETLSQKQEKRQTLGHLIFQNFEKDFEQKI